jgi:hypothetical protein
MSDMETHKLTEEQTPAQVNAKLRYRQSLGETMVAELFRAAIARKMN